MFRIALATLVALHLVTTTGLSGQGGRWTIGERMDDFTNRVDYHFIRTTSNRGGWLELRCDPTAQIFNTTLVVRFGTESIVPYNELDYAFFRYKIDGQVVMEYGRPANLLLREIAEGVYASRTFDDEVSLVDRKELEFEVNYQATLTETFHVAGYRQSLNLLRTNCRTGPGRRTADGADGQAREGSVGAEEAQRAQEEDSIRALGLRTYQVRAGDSLWEIARAHGVTADRLRSFNKLRGSRIYSGQTLRIPPKG